jgi:hypothetical protein
MSIGMTGRYEFTETQNRQIGGLARKMRLVGLVAVVLGLVNLILGIVLLIYAFRDQLPAEALRRIPEDTLKQLAPPSQLWALVLQAAASGLIFLLIGLWTRSAAGEFQQIVATSGHDISHLMSALGALHKMYSLLYTLIIVGILAFLLSIGVLLYTRFSGLPTITGAGTPNVSTDMKGGYDVAQVSNDLKSVFTSVTDTLGEIKDPATAEAALPKLKELSGKVDGIKSAFDAMPASGKAAIANIAQGHLGTIKDLVNKVNEHAGPAKEKISPILNGIVEKLTRLTA